MVFDAKIGDGGAAVCRGFLQKQKMRKSKTIFVIAKSAFRFANALCVRILITTKMSTAFIVINYYYCSMRKCADEVVVAVQQPAASVNVRALNFFTKWSDEW